MRCVLLHYSVKTLKGKHGILIACVILSTFNELE